MTQGQIDGVADRTNFAAEQDHLIEAPASCALPETAPGKKKPAARVRRLRSRRWRFS
jgi:hypothetical protein